MIGIRPSVDRDEGATHSDIELTWCDIDVLRLNLELPTASLSDPVLGGAEEGGPTPSDRNAG
jgi:hypothetical protein